MFAPLLRAGLAIQELTHVITPAFAQGAAPAAGGSDILMSMIPFVLIFIIMWFLIIRPQQKRVKDHRALISNVRRGDSIVSSGGIVARVTKVIDDSEIEAEIADGVRVRMVKSMITDVRAKGEPAKAEADEPTPVKAIKAVRSAKPAANRNTASKS